LRTSIIALFDEAEMPRWLWDLSLRFEIPEKL